MAGMTPKAIVWLTSPLWAPAALFGALMALVVGGLYLGMFALFASLKPYD
jgi:hypothetical protein